MSLMRLLTSGKTLIGLQDTRPQYRMADPRSMPVFSSAKSPFRKKAEAARAEAKELVEKIGAPVSAELRQPELASLKNLEEVRPDRECDGIRRSDGPLSPNLSPSSASVGVTRVEEGEREKSCEESRNQKVEMAPGEERTTGQPHGLSAQKQGPARLDRKFSWFSDWAGRLGSWLPVRPRPARSAIRAIAPQQGELALSLDAVKVVRNDLSDCDVEFVAKKQKAVSGKQKADYGTTGLQDDGTTGLLTNERADGKPEVPHTESALREGGALNAAWGRATRVFGAAFVRAASTDLVEKS